MLQLTKQYLLLTKDLTTYKFTITILDMIKLNEMGKNKLMAKCQNLEKILSQMAE